MPPSNVHVPAVGSDDALDFFNRKAALCGGAAPAAASATALVNAYALAVGTTTLTPATAPAATIPIVTYGQRNAYGSVTSPVTNVSDGGRVNLDYMGQALWKLDVPRTLQYVASNAAQAGNVVVTGLNERGQVVSETVTLNGVTVVHGAVPFAYIISIVLPAKAGAYTASVGTDNGLGMQYRPLDADSEHRVYVSGAKGTNGTIDATNYTYTPNSAPDGVKTYTVIYDSID